MNKTRLHTGWKHSRSHRLAMTPFCACAMLLLVTAEVQAGIWNPRETEVLDIVNQQRGFYSLNSLNADDRLHEAALGHSQSMSDYNFYSHTTLAGPDTGAQPEDRIAAAGYDLSPPSSHGENIAAGWGYFFQSPTPTQMAAEDAARDVMYGTTNLSDLSGFFTDVTISSWDAVDISQSAKNWADWGIFRSANSQNTGWMGSVPHLNNILNSNYADLGVGYVWEPDDEPPIITDGAPITSPRRTYWTQNFAAGDTRAVPLPTSIWLLGPAVLGLFAVKRRRRM